MINIFETELEKGTGIPYILIKNEIVKASPEVDSILLDNILNCTAYDPQCEGLRSEYMYSIVENYPNRAAVYKGVLDFFEKMTDTDWGDQQTFAFVCILAEKNIADKKIITFFMILHPIRKPCCVGSQYDMFQISKRAVLAQWLVFIYV